jgi:hypothetical protein
VAGNAGQPAFSFAIVEISNIFKENRNTACSAG